MRHLQRTCWPGRSPGLHEIPDGLFGQRLNQVTQARDTEQNAVPVGDRQRVTVSTNWHSIDIGGASATVTPGVNPQPPGHHPPPMDPFG